MKAYLDSREGRTSLGNFNSAKDLLACLERKSLVEPKLLKNKILRFNFEIKNENIKSLEAEIRIICMGYEDNLFSMSFELPGICDGEQLGVDEGHREQINRAFAMYANFEKGSYKLVLERIRDEKYGYRIGKLSFAGKSLIDHLHC